MQSVIPQKAFYFKLHILQNYAGMWNQRNKTNIYVDHHTKYFALLSMYF